MQLSPQHLAEVVEAISKREDGGSDKRRFARFAVVSRVKVLNPTSGRSYIALTRDVSMEGIGLMQSESMGKGEQLAVSLPRGRHGPLVALCTVLHARELADGIWGIGALFASASAQAPPEAAASANDAAEAQRIAAKMLG